MHLKRHTNHLILSSYNCFIATPSSPILFYNVNNNSTCFHKLQDILKLYRKKYHQFRYIERTLGFIINQL
jgi:hypothetical protein